MYSYLIVYRLETQPLQVIRVLNAARDVRSILGLIFEEQRTLPALPLTSTPKAAN